MYFCKLSCKLLRFLKDEKFAFYTSCIKMTILIKCYDSEYEDEKFIRNITDLSYEKLYKIIFY